MPLTMLGLKLSQNGFGSSYREQLATSYLNLKSNYQQLLSQHISKVDVRFFRRRPATHFRTVLKHNLEADSDKKGLCGGVFWASIRHTLSDLHKIWWTYGHDGRPSSISFLLNLANRWRRNRRRAAFLDVSCCTRA